MENKQRTAHVNVLKRSPDDIFEKFKQSILKLKETKHNERLNPFICGLAAMLTPEATKKESQINLINYLEPVLIKRNQFLLLTNELESIEYLIKFSGTHGFSPFPSIIFTRINNLFFIQEEASSFDSAFCMRKCILTSGHHYVSARATFKVSINSKCILKISYKSGKSQKTESFEENVSFGHDDQGKLQLNPDSSKIGTHLGTLFRCNNHWEAVTSDDRGPMIIRSFHSKSTISKSNSHPLILKNKDIIRIEKLFLEVNII